MHYKTCEICGLRSGRSNDQKRIFMAKFPLNEDRCKKWVKVTGKEDLVYVPIEKLHQLKHICGSHFLSKDFKKKKTQLRKNAIPSVGLTAEPLADELFIGFPLHIFKSEQTLAELSSIISMEHDYCGSLTGSTSIPSTSAAEPLAIKCSRKRKICSTADTFLSTAEPLSDENCSNENVMKKMRLSPIPSTSAAEPLTIKYSRERKICSTAEPLSDENCSNENVMKKMRLSPIPSTSAAESLAIKYSRERKICSAAEPLSDENCSNENVIKRMRLSPIPSTSAAESLAIKYSRERKICSAADTFLSTAEPLSDENCSNENVMKKMRLSPVPSTSAAEPLAIKCSRERKICSTAVPSTSTAKIASATIPKRKPTKTSKIEPNTPRKRKLLKKLRRSNVLIKSLQKKVDQIEKISSPVLKSLIESTVKNEKRKAKGRRWSKLNKSVALALYKKSPKAYRYFSQLLSMPSVRTLQSILENMKIEPGVDPCIVTHLKSKAEKLKDEDKICVILFDEMALKNRLIYNVAADKIDGFEDLGEGGRSGKIANHALVFMLQGLHKKMKQPVAHYFVKGTIETEKLVVIIKTVIRAMTAAGYKIIGTVCDQGPTNMGALNLLKKFSAVPVESNYFLLDNEKVFIIFDVPHLFKSIRNNFLQAGELVIDGKTAKWQHLIDLEEKNRTTLHFKKITKLHVNPKYRTKMRVKLAAQILSNTVAAVLKLQSECIQSEQQSKEILQTAEVVELLDRLFDSTNGPASKKDIKKNIRQNVSKNSFHHNIWPEYKQKLKTLQFLKSDSQIRLKNVRCVKGYLITISSLEDIWKFVASKHFKFLNLRQLNQDALENLFGIIRQHSPTNRNPTCHHFVSALKSSILTRLSTPKSRGSNCEEDDNEILFDFQEIVFSKQLEEKEKSIDPVNKEYSILDNADHPVIHIPEIQNFDEDLEKVFKSFDKQPTVYVSGYLASVVLKNVNCEQCINCMKVLNPKPNSYYNYIALREWWPDKTSLTYPTLQLCQNIDIATTTFDREVKPIIYIKDVSKFANTVMLSSTDFSWVCPKHKNIITDHLLRRLSHLLIRNECGIVNRAFELTEEVSADSEKKAQQMSLAK